MRPDQIEFIREFTAKEGGKAALSDLFNALETLKGPAMTLSAENQFLLAASAITGERPPEQNHITGGEHNAHKVLWLVLKEGDNLSQLRQTLSII